MSVGFCETLVPIYQTTLHYSEEDCDLSLVGGLDF
jgi:hypothetical protein